MYYTFADIVLLAQCFYYKGFTLSDEVRKPQHEDGPLDRPDERSPLLEIHGNGGDNGHRQSGPPCIGDIERRNSHSSFRERLLSVDGTHLSPVTPLLTELTQEDVSQPCSAPWQSNLQAVFFNISAIVLVCAAGVFGWWLSNRPGRSRHPDDHPGDSDQEDTLHFNVLGQVFGYICAVLYLGSRLPQLLLNYRRKSTEGISMLFFLFACIGNLTYVLSIFAYSPVCRKPRVCEPGEASSIYSRYIVVNLSWLLGSLGTLLLDAFVFVQYFLYQKDDEGNEIQNEAQDRVT